MIAERKALLRRNICTAILYLRIVYGKKDRPHEDFKEDIIPKEDFLEIRAQYDSKITDALIAKEQVQRELNLELDKSGRRSQWVQDLIAHQNIPSLTRAVAVECMEQIRVYEDKTLEIEFAHAQDYAEMLAQVQESYSNVADSDKAVV